MELPQRELATSHFRKELASHVSRKALLTSCLPSTKAGEVARGEPYGLTNNSLFGLGSRKLMFGGMVFFSKARTALMMLVIPEAPSEWPTLGLTFLGAGTTSASLLSTVW